MGSSKSSTDDLLVISESWVHVGNSASGASTRAAGTPGTMTPHQHQLTAEDYLRLLREAQRDSAASSARVSPRSSPKSPPNSPVQSGTPLVMDWHSYYVNSDQKEDGDFFTDWSSRPDQIPPKSWPFRQLQSATSTTSSSGGGGVGGVQHQATLMYKQRDGGGLSLRYARVGNASVFSRQGLYTLFLTNLLSLLLGTGVGIWLCKNATASGVGLYAVKVR